MVNLGQGPIVFTVLVLGRKKVKRLLAESKTWRMCLPETWSKCIKNAEIDEDVECKVTLGQ